MKDIVNAIKLKAQYLSDKSIPFSEELKKFGYTDINEFLFDEAQYKFCHTNFEVQYMTDPVIQSHIVTDAISQNQNSLFIVIPSSTFVWVGNNSDYNETYCQENNIPVLFEPYNGGAICVSKDDLQIAITMNNMPTKLVDVLLNNVYSWIKLSINNYIETVGNDILVDGKKVVGFGYSTLGQMGLVTIQVSFSVDIDFIKNIYTKEMNKKPAGLNEFNQQINRDMLVKEVLTWLT